MIDNEYPSMSMMYHAALDKIAELEEELEEVKFRLKQEKHLSNEWETQANLRLKELKKVKQDYEDAYRDLIEAEECWEWWEKKALGRSNASRLNS